MDRGMYDPLMAGMEHLKARRCQCPKLKIDDDVWSLAKPRLELRRSPEEIVKWLKTIYNYLYFQMKGELKKLALEDLRRLGKARKKGNATEKRGKIAGMTLIDTLPAEKNTRSHRRRRMPTGNLQKNAWVAIEQATGGLASSTSPGRPREINRETLKQAVEAQPDLYLREYAAVFRCSISAVDQIFKEGQMTLKKTFACWESSEDKRAHFTSDSAGIPPEACVYLDESGIHI